jgi:hypothetical protein
MAPSPDELSNDAKSKTERPARIRGPVFSEPMAEEVLERLMLITDSKNDSQLAKWLEISQTTVSSWRSRNVVPYEACVKVAIKTKTSLDVIIFGEAVLNEDVPTPIEGRLFETCWRLSEAISSKSDKPVRELAVSYYNARAKLFFTLGRFRNTYNYKIFLKDIEKHDLVMIEEISSEMPK